MHKLNVITYGEPFGVYAQKFPQTHKRAGHVFQGRYKVILIEKESYLLEFCRYVELNPVKSGIVESL